MDIVTFQTDICSNVLISVVIPVYNVEKYLNECLDSVVNQTHRNIEIILVDDGSTDTSGSICDEYRETDPRVIVIHQSNGGLGHARNIGINQATGKYIIFLDSDDYWELDTLDVLVTEAEKNNLQVVVFAAEPFSDGIDHYKGFSYHQSIQNGIVKDGFDSYECAISNGQYYSQACLRFYRLDYIKHESFLFDEGIIHEDESFSFLAYVNAKRIECIGEKLYHHRFRPNSIMTGLNPVNSSHGYCVALETIMQRIEKKSLSRSERDIYNKQLMGYVFTIFRRYRTAKQLDKHKNASESDAKRIISNTSDSINKVFARTTGFPWYYKILFSSFYTGYLYWLIFISRFGLRL